MCTCITYLNGDFYFGRNLDLDCSFAEAVTITPRNFPLDFRKAGRLEHHYAMIGMASKNDSFPLYAEAVNEKGLCMAGLNFPGNAFYRKPAGQNLGIASFEVIAWILGKCASVSEAEEYLKQMTIVDSAFSERMVSAPLHWMLVDREKCLVIEPVREGLKVYDNPFGVLTNNPPFEYHRMNMNNYMNLSPKTPGNHFTDKLELKPYGQGLGAFGLPGDSSPASRFVRAAFLKCNSVAPKEEGASVAQFFHVLDAVAMVRGAVVTEQGTYDITMYSCCVNTRTGVYYYKTYDDVQVRAVDMNGEDLEGDKMKIYEL
nr:choloylglycine hydrolase [uncultured Mediterraneibacter sp.]